MLINVTQVKSMIVNKYTKLFLQNTMEFHNYRYKHHNNIKKGHRNNDGMLLFIDAHLELINK